MVEAASTLAAALGGSSSLVGEKQNKNERRSDVRSRNIIAAKAVADMIRTSLGPRGMDKMIQGSKGEVVITNDGATILKETNVKAPTANMLVELSKAQDIEAGDGTTSVVVIAGALLGAAQQLLEKGIHAQCVAQCFIDAADRSKEILRDMSFKVELDDDASMLKAASTSLNSKVVSSNAQQLAPIAVEAVRTIYKARVASDSSSSLPVPESVDLKDIKIVKKLGGTVEDTEMVRGVVFGDQMVSKAAGGPSRMKDAKIGLIQFCLSPPKTDMDNTIAVKDYQAMDRLLREERAIIAKQVKAIAKTGCNVLLIQKSILRDAVTDLSLDYLAKAKILVIRDVEREDVDFLSRTIGCEPVASLDHFLPEKLGSADLVGEEDIGGGSKVVKITGIKTGSNCTVTVLARASNQLVLDETERSLHDALCVVRCIVKRPYLLPGGAAPEMELVTRLCEWARTCDGEKRHCVKAFAEALEIIPYTLAENAGLNAIEIVTELRNKHAHDQRYEGINVRKCGVSNMADEKVFQPLLVSESAVSLAAETVVMILKIDDIVQCR